MNTSRTR